MLGHLPELVGYLEGLLLRMLDGFKPFIRELHPLLVCVA